MRASQFFVEAKLLIIIRKMQSHSCKIPANILCPRKSWTSFIP